MGHIRVCIGKKIGYALYYFKSGTRKERGCLGIEISILHSPNRLTITGASCTEGDLNPGPRIWCKWGLGDGKPELFSLLNPTNSENISNTRQLPTVNRTQQRKALPPSCRPGLAAMPCAGFEKTQSLAPDCQRAGLESKTPKGWPHFHTTGYTWKREA